MNPVHGEPSFHLTTPEVDLDVTARGGHLAPVVFHLPGRDVSPYALAPWEPGEFPDVPPLLSVLRGDFLCLPFGRQSHGPPHGETANGLWEKTGGDARSLHLRITAADSGAHVEKILSTRAGESVLYTEHRISQITGNFSYGNHPILDLSALPEGTGRVTTSDFHWASTFPGAFSDPANGETQALKESAVFTSLEQVELASGGTTDLTRYPARAGNDDLVMMANSPSTPGQPFAWSAVVLDGYLWFSLKNPRDFPATMLWISNGGRSASPWNGRHLGRLGVEEVCSYFSNGVDLSRQDLLAAQGIPTTRSFSEGETVSLKIMQGAALVPDGFGAVKRITPADDASIRIEGDGGMDIIVQAGWNFLL